jgi:hypothetical protein
MHERAVEAPGMEPAAVQMDLARSTATRAEEELGLVDVPVLAPDELPADEVTAVPSNPTFFRPDVEGLRAVAVMLVLLYHAGIGGVTGGFVGVDVFFVVSGFLITSLLVREADGGRPPSLRNFYARRVRRLLPAAFVVTVATVLASYRWLGFLRADQVADDGRWSAAFMANWHYADVGTNYLTSLDAPSPFQHFWSLAVEEQFTSCGRVSWFSPASSDTASRCEPASLHC